MNILVTGGNGYVARNLCDYLKQQNLSVRVTVRHAQTKVTTPDLENIYAVGNLSEKTNWHTALTNINTVFHLASAVHRPEITDAAFYNQTITHASIALAQQAAALGVKHFIYISTAHVYGIEDDVTPVAENSLKSPKSPYAAAKLATENQLINIAEKTGMQLTIIRPPIIYGQDSPGNFLKLVGLVNKSFILPFGLVKNKRSFVSINNLVNFLALCALDQNAQNKIFNISDDNDIATYELCFAIAQILGKKRWFAPVPPALLHSALKIIKKQEMYHKLFGSFCLDITAAKTSLGWKSITHIETELEKIIKSC